MRLSQIGEFGFIERIEQKFSPLLPNGVDGIGDDCAVVRLDDEISELISTDMLIENVHFLPGEKYAFDLGYKSLAVNLSDLAAMGGEPTAAFLSLAIPQNRELSRIDEFLDGFYTLARETDTPLLGGDTVRSPHHFAINVTIVGRAKNKQIKYRRDARPGDLVFVTGDLGNSAAGLAILKNENNPVEGKESRLVVSHLRPRPQLREGRWLAAQEAVHAMMDISDGLASDIRRIMEQSRLGARIHLDQLPMSDDLIQFCRVNNLIPDEFALKGGEDYCLLVTVDPRAGDVLMEQFHKEFSRPLHAVGEMLKENELLLFRGREKISPSKSGYDHFNQ